MGFFGRYDKPGKGVTEEDLNKKGIALYFDILIRRFWKLVGLNMMYLVASIPALFISWGVSAFLLAFLQSSIGNVLTADALLVMQMFTTGVFFLFTGSGAASVGMSYVIRKYVNDTHAWVWSDFFDSFKSNFLQGTIIYIINLFVLTAISVSLIFYNFLMTGIMATVLSSVLLVVSVIFIMMQMYIYPLVACFKLKIKDVYRNAMLLTLGKLPWNILAFAVTVVFISVLSYIISEAYAIFIIIMGLYSFAVYTQIFMTNNIVKKYVEEPALEMEKTKSESEEDVSEDE